MRVKTNAVLIECLGRVTRHCLHSLDVTFSECVCFSVLVVKGREDVTIKVSDRGGGIPRSLRDHIFEYLYTTAPNPILTNSAEITDVSSLIGGRSPKFYFPVDVLI